VRLRIVGSPLAQRCPQCDAAFVVQKVSRAGVRLRCLAEGCGWTIEPDADADGSAAPDAKGVVAPPRKDRGVAPTWSASYWGGGNVNV